MATSAKTSPRDDAAAPVARSDDVVMAFQLAPDGLLPFIKARGDKGPRMICVEGEVTLVSPGRSHEGLAGRLDHLILAVALECGVSLSAQGSATLWLPKGQDQAAYEPDKSYHVPSRRERPHPDDPGPPPTPDLAFEIVVSHRAGAALRAAGLLGIGEVWVLDVPRRRLTFHLRVGRGPAKGTYCEASRSRVLPMLTSAEVLERLDDPAPDAPTFFRHCLDWARRVLRPRVERPDGP